MKLCMGALCCHAMVVVLAFYNNDSKSPPLVFTSFFKVLDEADHLLEGNSGNQLQMIFSAWPSYYVLNICICQIEGVTQHYRLWLFFFCFRCWMKLTVCWRIILETSYRRFSQLCRRKDRHYCLVQQWLTHWRNWRK